MNKRLKTIAKKILLFSKYKANVIWYYVGFPYTLQNIVAVIHMYSTEQLF